MSKTLLTSELLDLCLESKGLFALYINLIYMCCSMYTLRYAMKCLDKKRIKMKQGETLALNERIMLSLVSTGVSFFFLFFF